MSRNFELMQQAEMERGVSVLRNPASILEPRTDAIRVEKPVAANLPGDLDPIAQKEALKLIQRIFLLQPDTAPRTVVWAGMEQGNGCSMVAVNAARTLAESVSGSVCLVDANLRSPSLHDTFNVSNHRGLAEALTTEGPIRAFAYQLQPGNFWLLPSGMTTDAPSLLSSGALRTRLDDLRQDFDYVLIDAPPLHDYSDAAAFGKLADGMVLVLEANTTRREPAVRITESLRASNVTVLGAVLNKRQFSIPDFVYRRL